jgi:hypothetical protein
MKQIISYGIVLVAAALLAGVAFQRNASAQRAPAPGPERHMAPMPVGTTSQPRFEYATLRLDAANERWFWTTPDEIKRGDKQRLFREMNGYVKPGDRDRDRDRDITYVDLATQAGLYGWELTTVVDREKGIEIWFKRPVR